MRKITILISILLPLSGLAVYGQERFYKELNIIGGYSDKDGWVGSKGKGLKNSVGFEYFNIFSDEYGDRFKVDLQMRFSYNSTEDSEDAWGVEFHNAWLEYKMGLGQYLIFGHFDPAFGLEPVVDTHGTLLQTLALESIGYKKDWGIGYKGLLGNFDIQLGAQLGSGMPIKREDDSFLFTTRLSSKIDREYEIGLSILYGQVLMSERPITIPSPSVISNGSIRKKRIGLDFQGPLGPYSFKCEAAIGDDEGTTVGGGLLEFGYVFPEDDRFEFKLQGLCWSDELDNSNERTITISPVFEYKMSSDVTLRTGYFYDISTGTNEEERLFVMQLYYYGI